MFGAFKPTSFVSGGLLWKNPWRLSPTRKANQRKRLKRVDDVISMVAESGVTTRSLVKALALPTEAEMSPRGQKRGREDKYTTFSKRDPGYRKSQHKVPKWTRLTLRENPKGF
ncbi:50S small subunit ribosomal protein L31 [Cryptococcus gattii E566]|nr:50S small subunit ribosomal protein L31 [Cryptococcus gattii E566]